MSAPAATEVNGSTASGAETPLTAEQNRQSICVQNNSDTDMWFSFTQTAANGTGWKLAAGESRVMYRRDWPEIAKALTLYCSASSKAYLIQTDV